MSLFCNCLLYTSIGKKEEIKEIRRNAIRAGWKLVDCPIRHLGTEKAQQIYLAIEQYLLQNGVEILFGCECEDVLPVSYTRL